MTTQPAATLEARVAALTLDEKVHLLTGQDFWSVPAQPSIGLRRLVLSDGPAGVRGELWDERDPSANIPSPTALSASWDEARVTTIGRLLAAEARRKGVDVLLAPTVNLHRSPYGGRHFECFSEDPLLTARIGVAYVEGLQTSGVAATVKHFVANDSETERFTVDARVDERALRELYLAPFEAIVRAGVWAVMAAYNSVNGTTMTEHAMLRDILHREWGFDGLVMSDWMATKSTVAAANAALDLVMPGPFGPWGGSLVDAVRAGDVPESAIDEKVVRLLRLAARVGALDGRATAPAGPQWTDAEVARTLRDTAAAGFVLARNEGGLLPVDATALRRVAVVGPNAAAARTLGGGSATVFPPYAISPLDGLRSALGAEVQVDHAVGARIHTRIGLPPELVSDPETGEPGFAVHLLDGDGTVLARQHRRRAQLTWLGSFGPDVAPGTVGAVEVRAVLTAPVTGDYAVGCSGLGQFRLAVDDAVLLDGVVEPPPDTDPVETLLRTPQWSTTVPLTAGEQRTIVLRYGVFGGLDIAKIELNVEPPSASPAEELARAVDLARAADVAVVVVGTTEEVESEGFDRGSLALPGDQDLLVRRVLEVNPRTVVVVNSGAPVLLPWAERAPAVLLTWFPGQEFGNALAEVLFGVAEPGGRLPVVWPGRADGPIPSTRPVDGALDYTESIHIGQRGWDRAGVEPAFPFGHGLGYTEWEYLDIEPRDGFLRVTVRNAGQRRGREVVQVYAARPDSAIERPVRWLAGFAAVTADPGGTVTVDVAVPERSLSHWDVESGGWAREPGTFQLAAGRSAHDLRLHCEL
jgi:beta-glucosidase